MFRNMNTLYQVVCTVPLYSHSPNPSGRRNKKYNTINLNNSYFCNWGRVVKGWKKTMTSKNSAC